jgi:acid phosphatase type 7
MTKGISLIIASLLIWTASSAFPPLPDGASAVPDNIRLTWSESSKTTQTIGWRTDASVRTGKVEFGAAGQPSRVVEAPPPDRLDTNVGSIHLFSVTLRDLQPGTAYHYRVGDGAHWSEYLAFETEKAGDEPFEFLVFGDSHEKKPVYKVWRDTVTAAYRQNPGARFMISLGDLIYAGRDYEQWQSWFAGCREIIARIPSMPVIGDHEPRGLTSKDEWQRPEYFVKLFRLPQNGPAGYKGEVYSFDYGAAHFAVLNSSFHYEFSGAAERRAMIEAESAWLDSDLAAAGSKWKIVVYHDATYGLSADRSGTLTKVHFGPIIDKHHADLVLNAHEHAMARSYFTRNGDFVADSAQGTPYVIVGRSGENAKEGLGRKVWHPFFYDPQSQACYLVVSVGTDELRLRTRLQDGTLVDDFRINRKSPSEGTPVVPFGAYARPRLVVFGTLLQFGREPERNAAGEWFVDVAAIATSVSGKFDPKTLEFSYDDGGIKLQFRPEMFQGESREMISLSGLTSQGFHCRHHPAMNLIMIERWRD